MKLSSTRAISAPVRGLRIAPAGVRAGGTLMHVLPLLIPVLRPADISLQLN